MQKKVIKWGSILFHNLVVFRLLLLLLKMLLQKLGIISALFIITTSSQKVQNSSGNCFPLNSKRFTSCPPGYVVQPLAKPPLPKNVIERRLFIRKLRNPLIKQSVFCCRIRAREEESDDSEKLLTSTQIQFPNNIRKPTRQNQQQQQQGQGRRRRRRRRRRRKPKTKIGAIINKLGDTVDDFLNTSISYRQYDGWTWTFRPFKILPFSGEEEVFEKYRTRRGRGRRGRNNFTSPRPPPLQNEIDAEDIKDLSPIPPLPIPSPVPRSPSPTPVPPPQKTPIKLVKADETISSPSPLLPSSTTISRYVVSLRRNGVHFCSGVVVDSKHVLTASNCFVSPVPGNAYETVVNVDPDGVTVKAEGIFDEFVVEHICVHNTVPNPTKELNEIAVINLARAVVFTGNFFPARLVWEGKGVDFGRPDNRGEIFIIFEFMGISV